MGLLRRTHPAHSPTCTAHHMKWIFFLLLVLSTHLATAQPPPRFTNLVLEGGGVKGIAYVGALEVLDSAGMLAPLQRLGGSSAGAIQAALIALGYTPAELKAILGSLDLRSFNDGSLSGGYHRMSTRFGFYRGQKVYRWLQGLVAAKTGDSSFTFGQLHALREARGYKDLYITGTDLSYRCLRVFSHENYPQMPIATALRISMSIPLYYEPVVLDSLGRVLTSKPWPAHAHLMVDGGMLSNFPIHLFDSSRFVSPTATGYNVFQPNPQTLGILLEKPEAIATTDYALQIGNLRNYLGAMYQTLVDKPIAPDGLNKQRIIQISHLNISGRVRQLPPATIALLVESGRQGARRMLGVNKWVP